MPYHVIVLRIGAPKLFLRLDDGKEERAEFGVVMEHPLQNPLALSGNLLRLTPATFLYSPDYASMFYVFAVDGSLEQTLPTPDGQPFPSPERRSPNAYRASKPEMVYSDISRNDSVLFVNTIRTGKKSETGRIIRHAVSILDVYTLNPLRYSGSVRLPQPVYSVQATGDTLICFVHGKVFAYRMK